MFFFGHNNRKGSLEVPMSAMRFQVVTPEEFMRLYNEKQSEIKSVKVIPPKFGNSGFGKIIIEWKNPVYVPLSELDEAFA